MVTPTVVIGAARGADGGVVVVMVVLSEHSGLLVTWTSVVTVPYVAVVVVPV